MRASSEPRQTPCARALVWFRRDLRDTDHAALAAALARAKAVYCVFVFDRDILGSLPRDDARVSFIHHSLIELDAALQQRGGGLIVRHGEAVEVLGAVAQELGVQAVFVNRDYEPAAKQRDLAVAAHLGEAGIDFLDFKGQVIFDRDQVLTQAGQPYTVFTPYARRWLQRLGELGVVAHASDGALAGSRLATGVPPLASLGFGEIDLAALGVGAGMSGGRECWEAFRPRMADYARDRDFPARQGASGLSVHLRFGTLSVRELVQAAWQETGSGAETWLKELIWREFYFQILDHFPQAADSAFRPAYEAIVWEDWPEGFAVWCAGKTGYPLVDAAMRQLVGTGTMHNRLRMLTASFLCKDLGIDWRQGEAFFARHLLDFDLAANNGGWQWAASSGCDAQPYFRIFNPVTQSERFDPEGAFIRRLVPELAGLPDRFIHAPWRMNAAQQQASGVVIGRDYPPPIVDHENARQKTLARYAVVKEKLG